MNTFTITDYLNTGANADNVQGARNAGKAFVFLAKQAADNVGISLDPQEREAAHNAAATHLDTCRTFLDALQPSDWSALESRALSLIDGRGSMSGDVRARVFAVSAAIVACVKVCGMPKIKAQSVKGDKLAMAMARHAADLARLAQRTVSLCGKVLDARDKLAESRAKADAKLADAKRKLTAADKAKVGQVKADAKREIANRDAKRKDERKPSSRASASA